MWNDLKKMVCRIPLLSAVPLLLVRRAIATNNAERFGVWIHRFDEIFRQQPVATNVFLFDLYKALIDYSKLIDAAKRDHHHPLRSGATRMLQATYEKGLHLSPKHVPNYIRALQTFQQWDVLEKMVSSLPVSHLCRDDANILSIYMCSQLAHHPGRLAPPEDLIVTMINKFDLDPMRCVSEMKYQYFIPVDDKVFIHENHNLWNICLQNVLSSKVLCALLHRLPSVDQCTPEQKDDILDHTCTLMQRRHSIDPQLLLDMEDKGMGVKHMVVYILNRRLDQPISIEQITDQMMDDLLSKSSVPWQKDVQQALMIRRAAHDQQVLSEVLAPLEDVDVIRPHKKMKM